MMTKKIRDQIMAVRDSGETNMFDMRHVQVIASRLKLYDLIIYIQDNPEEYFHFILTGEAPMEEEDDSHEESED